MEVSLLIECKGEWIEPPLLDEPELLRAMNSAAVLSAKVMKSDGLSFAEGDRVKFLVDGAEIFLGRVFTKRRSRPEVIEILAYDDLRYLQNRDCCVFSGVTPVEMLKQIASMLDLSLGRQAAIDWRVGVRVYDNRRYIDMLCDVLEDALAARGKHYAVLAERGSLCIRACSDMATDVCIELGSFAGYEYRTSIDDGYANRVKLIYEDRRKAKRQQFVAEDKAAIGDYGVLQYVHKSAAAAEESYGQARAKLGELNRRCEELSVSKAPGDVSVRGGSLVWVKLDLGDRIVNSRALVKSARHYFVSGVCLMDLELDCSLF